MNPLLQHGPLLEKLLAGQFICAVTEPEHYQRLQQEALREQLDEYLQPLNRRVAQNDDTSVFFLAYRHIDQDAREHMKQQLQVVMASLLPLLEWLTYVQEALGHDSVLSPGDIVKLQELVLKTEDHPSLQQRLQALAKDKFFNSQADSVDAQAKQIAKRLVEHGYLQQPHKERLFFTVTGKMDYLLELVRFIKDEENIPLEESPQQEDLL